MRRREFITMISSAAVWPLAARAQQAAMPMIGFLSSRSPGDSAGVVAAFWQGLGELGFVEGQNVVITFRWAEGHYDRLPVLAAELVDLRVAALFAAGGPPSALAAKAATAMVRPSSSRARPGAARMRRSIGSANGVVVPRNPIVGSLGGCCARALSGHAPAAPPSSVMIYSRRLIEHPQPGLDRAAQD